MVRTLPLLVTLLAAEAQRGVAVVEAPQGAVDAVGGSYGELLAAMFGRDCGDGWCLLEPRFGLTPADLNAENGWQYSGSPQTKLLQDVVRTGIGTWLDDMFDDAAASLSPFEAYIRSSAKLSIRDYLKNRFVTPRTTSSWRGETAKFLGGVYLLGRPLDYDASDAPRVTAFVSFLQRKGRFDADVLADRLFADARARFPAGRVWTGGSTGRVLFVRGNDEFAAVQIVSAQAGDTGQVETLKLAVSLREARKFSRLAQRAVSVEWARSVARETGIERDEVVDYEVAVARKFVESDPAKALAHLEPLLFIGTADDQVRSLRAAALVNLERLEAEKSAQSRADRDRREAAAAADRRARERAAAEQKSREDAFWAGVDRDMTVATAAFDPALALGKTVVWSGLILKNLHDTTYLASQGGNLFVVVLSARLKNPGWFAVRGIGAGPTAITDGLAELRVPVVRGALVDLP